VYQTVARTSNTARSDNPLSNTYIR
jgi:hypothetical protein